MDEATTTSDIVFSQSFPEAILKEARELIAAQNRIASELSALLRGFFHARDVDPTDPRLSLNMAEGTYCIVPLAEESPAEES